LAQKSQRQPDNYEKFFEHLVTEGPNNMDKPFEKRKRAKKENPKKTKKEKVITVELVTSKLVPRSRMQSPRKKTIQASQSEVLFNTALLPRKIESKQAN
jgi:hypothetical protein